MRSATWVAAVLRDEGKISVEQYDNAVQHMLRQSVRIEEALLEIRAIDEQELLRTLAARFRTQFVSTDKLSDLEVQRAVLDRIPQKLAEQCTMVPILFDAHSGVLSIVMPDPDDDEVRKQAKMVSGAREVRTYLARPAAVRAAIAKWYRGEQHSFAGLKVTTGEGFSELMDVYGRDVLDERKLGSHPPASPARGVAAPSPAPSDARVGITPLPETVTPPPLVRGDSHRGDPFSAPLTDRDLAETLNVLLSLLEANRAELRGHSSTVARLCRQMGERIGLCERDLTSVTLAGYLHDLGKMGGYHLTAFNVAEYDGHRLAAQKAFSNPSRLFEAVRALDPAFGAVSAMYERFDGKGFPSRLAGKDIPLAARLLAICDSYADLTSNSRNPFRRVLGPEDAHAALWKHRDTIFDGNMLELFRHVVIGGDLRQKLMADRPTVLVVEPDAEEATVVELRLVSQGFDVSVTPEADVALALAQAGEVDFIISEVDLRPFDGFELLRQLHADERTRSIPFFFVARRSDPTDVNRSFELGASEFFPKPAAPDVIAAKLRRLLGERKSQSGGGGGRGVAGSLKELALPDLVQVLAHGRKSGRLTIKGNAGWGEVHFSSGAIVHATCGSTSGEEAFYQLLGTSDGSFALDPNFISSSQTIDGSAEMLLLEGMRRMDERSK